VHHLRVDLLASGESPLHRLDPRAKLAAVCALVVVVASLPSGGLSRLAAPAAGVLVAAFLGRLPLGWLARRLLLVLLFAGVLVTLAPLTPRTDSRALALGPLTLQVSRQGCDLAVAVLCKALLAAAATLVLVSTTRMSDLLAALRWLRVPRQLVASLALLYRSLFVLLDEAERMRRARLLRGGRRLGGLRAAGALLATLLVRAYERAEAVHRAMLARGLEGEPRMLAPLRFHPRDGLFLLAALALVAAAALGLAPW
jgi:cobalt/nickel transport system permease protein